jgi:hypothetical protein
MDNIFTYRDNVEGKIGIGKLPLEINTLLNDISKEYNSLIINKDVSTYHTWFFDMPASIKNKVEKIQKNNFWNKLCDNSDKCIKFNANEMDELYYSKPKNNLKRVNLYGSSSNYGIHRDCIFNFNGIKFYRILIGLTDGNDSIITYFNNFNIGHKINTGDYIVFDFDKTTHEVINEKNIVTPRIILKLHYILCENCKYSTQYVKNIKYIYLIYEYITRYIMKTGTDPKTYYQFFLGLGCQYLYTKYIQYIILIIIIFIILILKFIFKIKFIYKNISIISLYILMSLITLYFIIVYIYWARFTLFKIS